MQATKASGAECYRSGKRRGDYRERHQQASNSASRQPGQKLAALLMFLPTMSPALGGTNSPGLSATEAFYWTRTIDARMVGPLYGKRMALCPNRWQAGVYSVPQWLSCGSVKELG